MRLLIVLTALTLLIAGCGTADEPGSADPTAPESPDGGETDQGTVPGPETIEGTLAGDPDLEGGCVWLVAGGQQYEVLWPDGYRASPDPVQLLDPAGNVIAAEGDTVRVEGRGAADMVSICQVGIIFEAESVEVD